MPTYDPPASHYSQMDVSHVDEDTMFKFIGRDGRRFKFLTRSLSLDYLWYDKERRCIEIWGPFFTHENRQSALVIEAELENFLSRASECQAPLDDVAHST